jgi:hypothetical protein
MARLLYKTGLLRIMPPWLRRTWGAKLLEAIGDQIDAQIERTAEGVSLRFPAWDPNNVAEAALELIARERRIRRGPDEDALTHASRLRLWLDSHRTRGGPYALLAQLHAFWVATLDRALAVTGGGDRFVTSSGDFLATELGDLLATQDGESGDVVGTDIGETVTTGFRIDVVYHAGTRYVVDELGAVVRDAVAWNADGTTKWARFWTFFYVDVLSDVLATDVGLPLVTDAGDELVAYTVFDGTVSDAQAESFRLIPREWSAAHIDLINVVLLWRDARLIGYPPSTLGLPPGELIPSISPVVLQITD